ncbi:MAG: polynucleotide adenylyltransferase PcnB, partial [Planctomycetota bacterium]
ELEPKKYKNTIIFPASLDADAVKIIMRLSKFSHSAYLVGGCVRDLLLGSIPKDFDIATSARPRQVRRLFKNSKIIGRRFKLVHVKFSDKIIEVSTFRKAPEESTNFFKSEGLLIVRDNVYGSHRDDALRRDFTVNSLYYDLDNAEVIDYADGFRDVQRRVLRTIGNPNIRFQEDPVRILRAIRFSCRLKLDLDPPVLEAMKEFATEISKSAAQRVTEEIIRLMACGASRKALQVMRNLGLFEILFPEVNGVLDWRSTYYGKEISGLDLLLNLAGTMDATDRGKRRFDNPLFLALLFSPLCGVLLQKGMDKNSRIRDPGVVLNNHLRPITLRMGISRWELSRIKQIIIAFMRLNAPRKRRRFKTRDFVQRSYFPEALEFYRQVMEATGRKMDRYRWWCERFDEISQPVRSRAGGRTSGLRKKPGKSTGKKPAQDARRKRRQP